MLAEIGRPPVAPATDGPRGGRVVAAGIDRPHRSGEWDQRRARPDATGATARGHGRRDHLWSLRRKPRKPTRPGLLPRTTSRRSRVRRRPRRRRRCGRHGGSGGRDHRGRCRRRIDRPGADRAAADRAAASMAGADGHADAEAYPERPGLRIDPAARCSDRPGAARARRSRAGWRSRTAARRGRR